MSEKIILLADGTGNSAGSATKTNVWRLYQALDLNGTEQKQIACFVDGVGTSWLSYEKYLGLAFGYGLKSNVLDLYKFVCRNYKKGDEIFAFGFSRGAFTIRVLVQLINTVGVVAYEGDDYKLDREVNKVYKRYLFDDLFNRDEKGSVPLPVRLRYPGVKFRKDSSDRRAPSDGVGVAFAPSDVVIAFMGLWDTVSAVGFPVEEITYAWDRWIWPLSFSGITSLDKESGLSKPDFLPLIVKHARHALSLDDERRSFFPIPWKEEEITKDHVQVWFSGVHANVGGGYADDLLSYVSLNWMIQEAKKCGLALGFSEEVVKLYREQACSTGRMYDSRAGLGSIYRYAPRNVRSLMQGAVPLIHWSVIDRIENGSDQYAPISFGLVDSISDEYQYNVLDRNGCPIKDEDYKRDKNGVKLSSESEPSIEDYSRLVFDFVWFRCVIYFVSLVVIFLFAVFPWVPIRSKAIPRHECLLTKEVINLSDISFLSELFRCGVSFVNPFIEFMRGILVSLFEVLHWLLPDFLEPWFHASIRSPLHSMELIILIFICFYKSKQIQSDIHCFSRAVWGKEQDRFAFYHVKRRVAREGRALESLGMVFYLISIPIFLIAAWLGSIFWLVASLTFLFAPASLDWVSRRFCKTDAALGDENALSLLKNPGGVLGLIRLLRKNVTKLEQSSLYWFMRIRLFPLIALFGVFLIVIVGLNRVIIGGLISSGYYCPSSLDSHGADFVITEFCHGTGIRLKNGLRYRLTLTVNSDWMDRNIPADLGGIPPENESIFQILFRVLKRDMSANYIQPMARIGKYGVDEYILYPLSPFDAVPLCGFRECKNKSFASKVGTSDGCDLQCRELAIRKSLVSEIDAKSDGELFLFVNDAIVPFRTDFFYKNNQGSAHVLVQRVLPNGDLEIVN